MKRHIASFSVVFFLLFTHHFSDASLRLKAVATLYPLAHFAEQVGGDYVEVINITPGGTDPHEYEPTAKDIMKVWASNVFIFNGAGLDPWAEKIHNDLKKKGKLTLNMSEHFDLLRGEEGVYDSHIWLDPLIAVKEVEIIRDVFIEADPEHADYYRENSTAYINKLLGLHEKYKVGLKTCRIRDIIVSHDAFRYLARRYNLTVLPISGISPEGEPSPRKMAGIIEIARKKNIRYVFTEPLVSPKIAKTLSREIGADILVLNPLEGLTKSDVKEGKTYISIMEQNLNNLRLALSCN